MKVWYESSCVVNSSVTYAHDIFVSTCLKYFYILLLDSLFFIFCVSKNFVFSSLVCLARRNHVLCTPLYKLKKVMLISELGRNTKYFLSQIISMSKFGYVLLFFFQFISFHFDKLKFSTLLSLNGFWYNLRKRSQNIV